MDELKSEKCEVCRVGAPLLCDAELAALKPQIPDWEVVTNEGAPRIRRSFKFKNFAQALAFTNKVGEIAEAEKHHPAIVTEWGKVTVTWWSHAAGGLHKNDFIMAAKTDSLFGSPDAAR